MTGEQSSVIVGSLLGDGSIAKVRYGDSYFHKKQAAKRLEYLQWHFSVLRPWSSRIESLKTPLKDKVHLQNRYATRSDPLFTALRKEWYPDGHKIIPKDIRLDPLALAVWYCDDGYNDAQTRQIRFATQAFTPSDCALLVHELGRMGVAAYVTKNLEIRTATRSYLHILNIVSPYVRLWECFSYKIDISRYSPPSRTHISEQDKDEIYRLYQNGEAQGRIAEIFNKSLSAISTCLRKRFAIGGLALNNTSGIKGIFWDRERSKWIAHGLIDGRRVTLGRFSLKRTAIAALGTTL